jgi:hypothetical protein
MITRGYWPGDLQELDPGASAPLFDALSHEPRGLPRQYGEYPRIDGVRIG